MKPARAARLVAVTLPLLLGLSCGGAPPAPVAPAAQARAATAPAVTAPPDLTAVADPPALVLTARLARPSASLSVVRGWSGLPMPQSEEVAQLVTAEAVGPIVDLDQPIDLAVAVTGSGARVHELTAVSVALKDVDRAKVTLSDHYKLVPGDNGALLMQALGHTGRSGADAEGDSGDEEHRSCEIVPAYGEAAVRLVCGWNLRALTELAPWLTRTATRAATVSDLHLDLRMQPLRPAIAAGRRLLGGLLAAGLGASLGSAALHQLASGLGGDVVDFALDLDTVSVDLSLREPAATATATLGFAAQTSALARLATAHPERSAPCPPAFWQLPDDANFALFERGIDDAELARGRELALRVASEWLTAGLKDADRKPILDALGRFTSAAQLAYASGFDWDATKKALAAAKSATSDPAAREEAERASDDAIRGWRVLELDEPAGRLTAAMKDLTTAWQRPSVAAALRNANGHAPELHVAPVPKGSTLPPGTQHDVLEVPVESTLTATPQGVVRSHVSLQHADTIRRGSLPVHLSAVHIYIAPDGARTWLGIGSGEALVASKLAGAIASTGERLGGEVQLAPLKAGSFGAGGYVTLRGLFQAVRQVVHADDGTDILDEMSRLPHQGLVPIVFSLTARSDAAPRPVTLNLEVPRGAIEDAVKVVLRHGF